MELDFFQAWPQVSVAISFGAKLDPTLALYLPINCVAEIAVRIKAQTQAEKLNKSSSGSASYFLHTYCDELFPAILSASYFLHSTHTLSRLDGRSQGAERMHSDILDRV